VKILDFGLAQVREPVEEEAETATLTPAGTLAGTVMGTLGYMSPEQLRGEPADTRSDIFALGCVLYEMLSGQTAFLRSTTAETAAALLMEEPPPLPISGVAVPVQIERIARRCLEKSPEARFQSARDLAFALQQLTSTQVPAPTSAGLQADSNAKPSIAVLPFGNLSVDPEQEYFCDGMAEEIINALAHLDGLRVVARTSSFAFKDKHQDIREIGDALDVQTLLEGSVRKAGNRLRITAQLINVADGYHMWSERFDRTLEDIFAIQDEISMAIVDKLKVELLGGEREGIVKRYTDNLDAYNAYLMGLNQWNRLTPEGYEQSLHCYQEAIRLDDGFAPAYLQLAIWHLSQAFWGALSPVDALPVATEMVERALAIDDTISEAHCFTGVVHAFFERDQEAGERSLRRAVELGPNIADNHANLAALLTAQGRYQEAIEAAETTMRLDPLSPTNNAWACWWIGLGGRLETAISELEKLVLLDPNHWLPHHVLGDLYSRARRLDEAIAASTRAVALSGGNSIAVAQLSCLSYLGGAIEQANENLEKLKKRSHEAYVPPTFFSWIYWARGEWAEALRWMEEAARINDPWLAFHRIMEPLFPADPSIEAALQRYGG
jgi:serine/threonine-protein kinase